MGIHIALEIKGIDRMQRDLEKMAKRSVPFAARETLNTLAFEGRKIWQSQMQSSLTLRNQFTKRQALVAPARGLRVASMEAVLGHTQDYMRLLEFGTPEKAARSFRPIPTEFAAGQAKGTLPSGRKRAVRRANIITQLGALKHARGGGSRKARNARAVRAAIKTGKKLALLDMGQRKGIYRIMGSKRKPEIRKLYDLSKRSTPMPRIPTLQHTLTTTLGLAPSIAYAALKRQLERNGIGGF